MSVPPIDTGTLKDLNDQRETREDMEDDLPDKCPKCSQELSDAVESCPSCGMEFGVEEKEKSVKVAAIASLIFPGLGQFYNVQVGKGILFLILGALSAGYIYYYAISVVIFQPMIFIIIFWTYNIYDAFSTAKKTTKG